MKRLAVLIAVFCLLLPGYARAGTTTVLGFAQSYVSSDGSSHVHRGADVAAAGGSDVACPVAGTVAFAGRIPGPDGGTVLAVSVDTPEGRVSLLPLAYAAVAAGDQVDRGGRVGTLAQTGDPSSATPHLHIGLRKAGVYLDPSTLFASGCLEVEPGTGIAEPAASLSPQSGLGADSPSPAAGVSPQATVVGQLTPGVEAGMTGEAVASAASAGSLSGADASEAGILGQPQMQPGVSLAPQALAAPVTGASAAGGAVGTGSWLAQGLRAPGVELTGDAIHLKITHAIKAASVALAVALFGVVLLVTRRALTRQAVHPTMSNRFGRMLQHLRAGDTLLGLTSCPGWNCLHSPGAISPGEVTK